MNLPNKESERLYKINTLSIISIIKNKLNIKYINILILNIINT